MCNQLKMGLSDRYIGSCEFSKNSIKIQLWYNKQTRELKIKLFTSWFFITFLFIKFPASSRWQKTTMHVVKLLDVSHAPFLWVMLRLSGDPKPRVTEIHRSGDNTWQPHFVPGKRLGFGTFILNKYEQKSLHGFGRLIFIALCLACGNSGQVQATQGFSAYHFLFQALTLVAECIVQGIMFTLFYQRKRGSAFFSEDGHCWCLLLFCKAAAPRPDPSHCSWYFANVDIWTCGNDLEGILMIPYSYDYISLWWVTNPPFKGLNWIQLGDGFFQASLLENPMTSRGGGGWLTCQVCALNFANGKDVGALALKLGRSFLVYLPEN